MLTRLGQAIARPARRFSRDAGGVAALEFAMIVPVLLVLYMGGTEITSAVILNRKVQHAVAVMTDLTTQGTTLSKADLDGIFNVSGDILQPFDRSAPGLKIDAIAIDSSGKGKIAWSYARNTTSSTKNTAVVVPAEYASLRNAFLVTSQATYEYRPMGGYGLKNPITMDEAATFKPRTGTEIKCSDCP